MNHSEIRRKERLAEVREFAEENQIPVQNIQLLNTALTHTSYANEHKNEVIHDNERLEFLGDAVLDLVVGEYLFLRRKRNRAVHYRSGRFYGLDNLVGRFIHQTVVVRL